MKEQKSWQGTKKIGKYRQVPKYKTRMVEKKYQKIQKKYGTKYQISGPGM